MSNTIIQRDQNPNDNISIVFSGCYRDVFKSLLRQRYSHNLSYQELTTAQPCTNKNMK